MSHFSSQAYHPMTGELEPVGMLDNYFGHGQYGVRFPDGDIFRKSDVEFPMRGSVEIEKLALALQQLRLPVHDEKAAQQELADHLERVGLSFEREVRLSPSDIVDFMVGGIAIELKIKGSRSAALRQVERYAKHTEVNGVILLTNRSCLLPAVIDGKPALALSMGGAWL